MYEKSKKRKIALPINESNNKKKNLQFYINTETQQWTRRTRRKNSFDLINFPFANFKIIRTNEPFNSIIKHNQSNNARKHGRSKCRHISTSKKKKPLPPPRCRKTREPLATKERACAQSRVAIDFPSKFRSMTGKFINFVTRALSKSFRSRTKEQACISLFF